MPEEKLYQGAVSAARGRRGGIHAQQRCVYECCSVNTVVAMCAAGDGEWVHGSLGPGEALMRVAWECFR